MTPPLFLKREDSGYDKKMIEKLEKIGLSRIEARVYTTLVELGPSFAGQIIAKTKQHRQQVYNALELLEAKQLVSVSQVRGKRFFHPAHPKQLYALVDHQQITAQEVVPLLERTYNVPQEEILVYRGVEGYEAALKNRVRVSKVGSTISVIGDTGKEFYEVTRDIFDEYMRRLRAKKVDVHWVIYKSQLDAFKENFSKHLDAHYQARLVRKTQEIPVATVILDDRIQISIFYPNPALIEIANEGLAQAYKKYFDVLWGQGHKITS